MVEISPTAQPPVCRIVDYSKFLYQLKKKEKEQKAKRNSEIHSRRAYGGASCGSYRVLKPLHSREHRRHRGGKHLPRPGYRRGRVG